MTLYTRLLSVDEIEPLFERSKEQPVFLFKHSLTCPISTAAFQEYEKYLKNRADDEGGVHTLVEIQNAREVSSAIAERSGIRHESPQAILLRDGDVAWHASHWEIKSETLAGAIKGS
jgi:bacillithiol system protein YtxJ